MPRRVALMFQPGEGNGPPTWLVTLWAEVPAYRAQGWFLLADLVDAGLRAEALEGARPLNPPRYMWRLNRKPNHGSTAE